MSYTPLEEGRSQGSNGNVVNHHEDNDEEGAGESTSASAFVVSKSTKRQDSSLSEPLNSSENADDPFYVFREDLYRKLELVDESLADYLRVVHQTDSAVNAHELKDSKKQLKRHLKNAESTLNDVEMTVQLVTDNREKFSNIDDTALYERSALVRISRDRLMRAKQEMQSEAVKAKLLQDQRAVAQRRAGGIAAQNDAERENTALIVDSQARQSLLLQHQDETLDELETAVTRVNDMAGNIHDEIGQQNKMLNEMEEDLANAEEELGMVMGKLAKFLKTKDTWQLGTILCLMLTVIVLFLLVLYT